MSLVYYQGENNCGGLHGNSGTKAQPPSGYACMMTRLVSLWRRVWSKEPNTTDPSAAFGVVSLSSHDSEGAKDMASFRWAQQGSYGTLPNAAMPNTFMVSALSTRCKLHGKLTVNAEILCCRPTPSTSRTLGTTIRVCASPTLS